MTQTTSTASPSHTQICVDGGLRAPAQPNPGNGLIMTATLVPPTNAVARADPQDRLNDYLNALRFYLELPSSVIDRILFVDNSNADLTPLVTLVKTLPHDKRVELISFSGNDHDPRLGKAYGEFKLMDFGLAHTHLFQPDDIVWKTTGRLRVLNLPALQASSQRKNFDVLCDLHNLPWIGSGLWVGNQHMDLRVFAFRFSAWRTVFHNTWRDLNEPFDAKFLYHRVRQQQRAGLRLTPRFSLQPHLSGVSGRHLRDYNAPSQRIKDAARNLQRRILPWIWL